MVYTQFLVIWKQSTKQTRYNWIDANYFEKIGYEWPVFPENEDHLFIGFN